MRWTTTALLTSMLVCPVSFGETETSVSKTEVADQATDVEQKATTGTGAIEGTVTDELGNPLEGIGVDAIRNYTWGFSAPWPYVHTTVDGTYRIDNLEPGRYWLRTYDRTGWVNEIWPGAPCPFLTCMPIEGLPITVTDAATVAGIDFNTLGLLTGMMVIVAITRRSGVFQFVAIWSAKKLNARPWAILVMLSVLTPSTTVSSFLSRAMLSRKSHASVVQPGVLSRG